MPFQVRVCPVRSAAEAASCSAADKEAKGTEKAGVEDYPFLHRSCYRLEGVRCAAGPDLEAEDVSLQDLNK